jgi:hypothetical protein
VLLFEKFYYYRVNYGLFGERGMKIFAGQSALRIVVKTYCELSEVLRVAIRYKKPGGKTGEFGAGVRDVEKGEIIYECIEGDIDVSGWWVFWAFVTFADGRTAAGEGNKIFIWKESQ